MIRIANAALVLGFAVSLLVASHARAELTQTREDTAVRILVFDVCKAETVLKYYRQNEDLQLLLRSDHWRWFHKCAVHLLSGPNSKLDEVVKLLGKDLHQSENVKNLSVRVTWSNWIGSSWKYEQGPDTTNAATLASQLELIKALAVNPQETIRKQLNAGIGFHFYAWWYGVYLPYENEPFFQAGDR